MKYNKLRLGAACLVWGKDIFKNGDSKQLISLKISITLFPLRCRFVNVELNNKGSDSLDCRKSNVELLIQRFGNE